MVQIILWSNQAILSWSNNVEILDHKEITIIDPQRILTKETRTSITNLPKETWHILY